MTEEEKRLLDGFRLEGRHPATRFEDLPHEVQDFLWFNPLFHVTGQMRQGFYPTYAGDYVAPVFVLALGLGLSVLGLLLLSRHGDGLVHK